MTYQAQIIVVNRDGPNGGEYVNLRESALQESSSSIFAGVAGVPCPRSRWRRLCLWSMVVVVCVSLLGVVGFFAVRDGAPFVLGKVVIPTLKWEGTTFSLPVLGLLLFASMAIFPVLLVPSSPSMWIAGITLGYGYGFLLIISAMSLGMSLPFIIGSRFYHRIHLWLEKWPQKAAIVRLAGEGNWFHQFRAIALLRISPFPYIILNYAAVATNIKYYPYIFGSIVGVIPDTFLTMYSGILIRNLADVSTGRAFLSVEQIIYDTFGFCIALAATGAFTLYARRTLRCLQTENEMELLQ